MRINSTGWKAQAHDEHAAFGLDGRPQQTDETVAQQQAQQAAAQGKKDRFQEDHEHHRAAAATRARITAISCRRSFIEL